MDRDDHPHALTVTHSTPADSAPPRCIPSRDLQRFHALTLRNQLRVRQFLQAVAVIEASPVRMMGYAEAAATLAVERGGSETRLRVLYGEYVKAGRDWTVFIDKALEWKPAARIPAAFLAELQKRVDDNKRSPSMAINLLRAEWLQGASVPGYGTWKQWWSLRHPHLPLPAECPGHPDGWTLRNLRRKLDTSKFRRTAEVVGLSAAASHRPLVYTTRAGLWVGSHYQFDDLWHDFFVASLAEKKAGRPLELFAHDLFSARKFRWGFRVRTEDDSGKAQGLTMRMMRMLIASVVACDGYSPRGSVFMAEHGTAAISEEMERVLSDSSDGLIKVQRSGMQGAAAHAGQYGGLVRGNPRHKASLESSNKTVHNLTGALPGQTGTNRDKRPEQLNALLKYNDQLLAAARELPPTTAALLRFDLLTETQCADVLGGLYRIMDSFTEHNLEGWEAAGNVTAEAQILGAWLDQAAILSLPPEDREHASRMIANGRAATRTRRLSRGEVWQRGAGELVRMGGGVVCQILGDDFAAERKVSAHKFEFTDKELGAGVHRYESTLIDAQGRRMALPEGGKYLCTVNPFAPDELLLRDAKGRFLGTCERIQAVMRQDLTAMNEALGREAKRTADLLEPLRKRSHGKARARLALTAHNNAVIQDHLNHEAGETSRALGALASNAAPLSRNEPNTNNNTAGADETDNY